MELPNIGQQCAQSDCKQLDFLPLECKCGKKFCSEHFNLHAQHCQISVTTILQETAKTDGYKCSYKDCNEVILVPITCERCNQNFCVKHRHLTECTSKDEKTVAEEREKIAAPIRQFKEAKDVVDKQIEENLAQVKKKGKKVNLVNKVQLMKIKNKAKGLNSIPTLDRIYFNVSYHGNDEGVAIFVSKNWSVGRVIDAIANECRLKNDNNIGTGKKLRLFKKENNEILTNNLAEIMEMLISNNVIVDGEHLVINYLDG